MTSRNSEVPALQAGRVPAMLPERTGCRRPLRGGLGEALVTLGSGAGHAWSDVHGVISSGPCRAAVVLVSTWTSLGSHAYIRKCSCVTVNVGAKQLSMSQSGTSVGTRATPDYRPGCAFVPLIRGRDRESLGWDAVCTGNCECFTSHFRVGF